MFTKSTCLALFTLAFSALSTQAMPARGPTFETETFCNTATIAISTVVQTQTVEVTRYLTAPGSQSTGSSGNGGFGSGASNGGGKGDSGSNSSGNGGFGSGASNNGGQGNSGSNSSNDKGQGGFGSGNNSGKGSGNNNQGGSSNNQNNQGSGNNNNQGGSSNNQNNQGSGNTAISTGGSAGNTGAGGGNGGQGSSNAQALQTSLELDPSVICNSFEDDGQNPPVTGQTASSTSSNNYINFCLLTLPQIPLTNGLQITTGSCNPTPIGLIPSVNNMPSAKFTFPKNFGTIPASTAFNVSMALRGMQAGVFTNAQKTYFAAPQRLNPQGEIIGHTHIVIEALTSIDQDTPTNSKNFVFFKGINDAGVGGILSTPVTAGVPPGAYRVCTINTSSNHQPVIVPIAQHGSLDDCSYFTAVAGAASASASVSAVPSASAVKSASILPSASAVAPGKVASASAVPSAVAPGKVASASAVPSIVLPKGSSPFQPAEPASSNAAAAVPTPVNAQDAKAKADAAKAAEDAQNAKAKADAAKDATNAQNAKDKADAAQAAAKAAQAQPAAGVKPVAGQPAPGAGADNKQAAAGADSKQTAGADSKQTAGAGADNKQASGTADAKSSPAPASPASAAADKAAAAAAAAGKAQEKGKRRL